MLRAPALRLGRMAGRKSPPESDIVRTRGASSASGASGIGGRRPGRCVRQSDRTIVLDASEPGLPLLAEQGQSGARRRGRGRPRERPTGRQQAPREARPGPPRPPRVPKTRDLRAGIFPAGAQACLGETEGGPPGRAARRGTLEKKMEWHMLKRLPRLVPVPRLSRARLASSLRLDPDWMILLWRLQPAHPPSIG
jgi:hypothetical protein